MIGPGNEIEPSDTLALLLFKTAAAADPVEIFRQCADGRIVLGPGFAAAEAAGFVIVPRQPTEAMLDAGNIAALDFETLSNDERFICEKRTWQAMIDAALDCPTGQLAEEKGRA
jgi:hypothetical protein